MNPLLVLLFKESFNFNSLLSDCEIVRKRRFFLGALFELKIVLGVKMLMKELIVFDDDNGCDVVVVDICETDEGVGVSRRFEDRKSVDWLIMIH